MASLTRWTWVWVNSGSWWWTGRPGVLQFMGLQRVRHDWATELNWTELNWDSFQTCGSLSKNQSSSLFSGGKESINLSTCQPIYLLIYPYLSIYLLSICLSICLLSTFMIVSWENKRLGKESLLKVSKWKQVNNDDSRIWMWLMSNFLLLKSGNKCNFT